MTSGRTLRLAGAILALSLACLMPARSQEDFGFMPKGGDQLLVQLLGHAAPAELRGLLSARRTAQEWQQVMQPHASALNEREQRTLAAYLATILPLPDAVVTRAVQPGRLSAALPPDGNALAWNNCQSCHSLFSGYLMQDRDRTGWLSVFQSPFHRAIKLNQQEREAFAGYSAINMPMQRQDVPPDLRF